MMLRTDPKRLREEFRLVRDLNLNTIRLEGKLDTDDFFNLADQNGILVMLGWCCCDTVGALEELDARRPSASPPLRCTRRCCAFAHHPSLLVWLNGSDNPPPANVESAYLEVEAQTHWPNPIISSASEPPPR